MASLHRKLFPNSSPEQSPLDEGCSLTLCIPADCSGLCPPNLGAPLYPPLRLPPPLPPIPPPPPPPHLTSNIKSSGSDGRSSSVILIIVTVGASLVLLGAFLIILKCFSRWWAQRNGDGQSESEGRDGEEFLDHNQRDHPIWFIRTIGLQSSVIRSIAVCRYKKGESLIEGTDCSVCLNEFQDGESLRILPKCNHAFHISCIDTWLTSHTNCPLCRAQIVLVSSGHDSAAMMEPNPDDTDIQMEFHAVDVEADQTPERVNEGTETRVESEREIEDGKDEIGSNNSVIETSYPNLDIRAEHSEMDEAVVYNQPRNAESTRELISDDDPAKHLNPSADVQIELFDPPDFVGKNQPRIMNGTEKEDGATAPEESNYDRKEFEIEKHFQSSDQCKKYVESHSAINSNSSEISGRSWTLQLLHKNPVSMKRSASSPRRLFSSRNPNSIIPTYIP